MARRNVLVNFFLELTGKGASDDDKLQAKIQQAKTYEGREAIYWEMPIIARVRLIGVKADSWGVMVTAVPIVTPGLWFPRDAEFTSSASWTSVSLSSESWSSLYSGWQLIFNTETVQAVVNEAASSAVDTDSYWQRNIKNNGWEALSRRSKLLYPALIDDPSQG